MEETIRAQLQAHRALMEAIEEELSPAISQACDLLTGSLAAGRKVLIMGNGGSAADAQHFAAEIVGRFKLERRGLPAIALTTDTSLLTAIGNDYGFAAIFRRQIEALASKDDVVVGISTSGSSANVREALLLAGQLGCKRIGLLGRDGGTIKDCVEIALTVPSQDTPRIQEGHITIIHIICDIVERALFPQK